MAKIYWIGVFHIDSRYSEIWDQH